MSPGGPSAMAEEVERDTGCPARPGRGPAGDASSATAAGREPARRCEDRRRSSCRRAGCPRGGRTASRVAGYGRAGQFASSQPAPDARVENLQGPCPRNASISPCRTLRAGLRSRLRPRRRAGGPTTPRGPRARRRRRRLRGRLRPLSPQLLAFCRHMLGSAEEAEDALQHTFIAAYRDAAATDRPITSRPGSTPSRATAASRSCARAASKRRSTTGGRRRGARGRDPSARGPARTAGRPRGAPRGAARRARPLRAGRPLAMTRSPRSSACGGEGEGARVPGARVARRLAARRERRRARRSASSSRRLRGGALRATLRRHLDACPGCAEF